MKPEFAIGDAVKLRIDNDRRDKPTYVFGTVVDYKTGYGVWSYGFKPDAGEGWFWSQKVERR